MAMAEEGRALLLRCRHDAEAWRAVACRPPATAEGRGWHDPNTARRYACTRKQIGMLCGGYEGAACSALMRNTVTYDSATSR
jgi:hypothetical protein